MMAAYFLTPIYASSEKQRERIKGPLVTAITPDEGTRQDCRNVGSMNCNFSVTLIKSLNQSSIKPRLSLINKLNFLDKGVKSQ